MTFLIKTGRDIRWHAPHTAAVFCAYVLAMWFDGPLLAGQAALGSVGLLHLPILGAGAIMLLTDNRRANVLAPCIAAAALGTVMLIRFLR